jgi:hypothetical protein
LHKFLFKEAFINVKTVSKHNVKAIGSASKMTISHVLGSQERASIPIMFLWGYLLGPIDRRAHRNLNTCP